MNPFGLPFKVSVKTGEKKSVEWKQEKMCFSYTKPNTNGTRPINDPTGNTAVYNVMKNGKHLPWSTDNYNKAILFKERYGGILNKKSGDHGILQGKRL